MNMITRMVSKQKINTIGGNLERAVCVHQWVCGLDADSAPRLLRAAEQDVIENGLVFVMAQGAEHYQACVKKLYPALRSLALTKAMGSDEWWGG